MIQEAVKNINNNLKKEPLCWQIWCAAILMDALTLLDTGYVFILNLRIYCVISNEKAKDKQP